MRTRLMRISLLTPFLLALLFVTAGNAFGQFDSSALYNITAKHSGKCLDVSGGPGSVGNGVQVIQWDCNGGENQQWTLTHVGDNYYKILAKHSGKGLDVFGGIFSLGNGVIVVQWDYNAWAHQMWKLIPVGEGYYKILARHSGKSLEIDGGPGAIANGVRAQQWDYVGGDNQQFRLTALPGRPACTATDSLISTFTGTAELRTNHPDARGPFRSNINLTVKFSDCRASISITSFPPIVNSFGTLIGQNTSTVSLIQGDPGSFDSSTGRTVIPVTLGFANSLRVFGNSTLPLRLLAEGVPAGNKPDTGIVTLSGTGTFMGGALGGYQGTLTVTGSFSPRPR